MPGSTVAGCPSLGLSLCRRNCRAAPPSAPPSSLSESPWAPPIVFGIADTRCGVGVGVRVLLPPVVSLRDIRPPSSRCQRIACKPSCSAISEGALSALSPCDGATLFNSSRCSILNSVREGRKNIFSCKTFIAVAHQSLQRYLGTGPARTAVPTGDGLVCRTGTSATRLLRHQCYLARARIWTITVAPQRPVSLSLVTGSLSLSFSRFVLLLKLAEPHGPRTDHHWSYAAGNRSVSS